MTPANINVEGRAAGACGRGKTSCAMHDHLDTELVDALWDNYKKKIKQSVLENYKNTFPLAERLSNLAKAIEIPRGNRTPMKRLKSALTNKTMLRNKLTQTGHPKR